MGGHRRRMLRTGVALLGGLGLASGGFALAANGSASPSREHLDTALLSRAVPANARLVRYLGPTRAGANSATFNDPAGDAVNNGPDVTTVGTANDDAGKITIAVTLGNRARSRTSPALQPSALRQRRRNGA